MTKKVEDTLHGFDEVRKKIDQFDKVLQKIEHADSKKKLLWREIYENASTDRQNAHVLFVEAYTAMNHGTAEHSVLGAILTKYLERMSKSNDQLLKLAELIAKSETDHSTMNADDLFEQIQGE